MPQTIHWESYFQNPSPSSYHFIDFLPISSPPKNQLIPFNLKNQSFHKNNIINTSKITMLLPTN